jgi:hypothetical protein
VVRVSRVCLPLVPPLVNGAFVALFLGALSATSCASNIKGPGGDGTGDPCANGSCDPLPVGGESEGETGEGEGDVGEGEGDVGEGEGDVGEGEGEGDVGEGEGEGDLGAAGTLLVTAGPEATPNAIPGCQCNVVDPSAANIDIALVAPGGNQCKKPSDQSCGVDGGRCSCALPGAQWFVSRQETPRDANEIWPVDEAVSQTSGSDGSYIVRATAVTDCLTSPASINQSTMQSCFFLDCDGDFGGPPACFDYTQIGANCTLASDAAATVVTDADCMARGPVPVRVHVEVVGGFAREFCATLNNGASVDAVTLRKTGEFYSVVSVSPQVHEVAVGASCP